MAISENQLLLKLREAVTLRERIGKSGLMAKEARQELFNLIDDALGAGTEPFKVHVLIVCDIMNAGSADATEKSVYATRAGAEQSVINDAQGQWQEQADGSVVPETFEQACEYLGYNSDDGDFSMEIYEEVVR